MSYNGPMGIFEGQDEMPKFKVGDLVNYCRRGGFKEHGMIIHMNDSSFAVVKTDDGEYQHVHTKNSFSAGSRDWIEKP